MECGCDILQIHRRKISIPISWNEQFNAIRLAGLQSDFILLIEDGEGNQSGEIRVRRRSKRMAGWGQWFNQSLDTIRKQTEQKMFVFQRKASDELEMK
jgi:hypothetical protein